MTTYRKADGTAFSAEELKKMQTRANRLNGTFKARVTRMSKLNIPSTPQHPNHYHSMSATEYVRQFDKANHLMPCAYTWQAHPKAHWGHYEPDTAVEVRDAA